MEESELDGLEGDCDVGVCAVVEEGVSKVSVRYCGTVFGWVLLGD